MSSDGQMQVHRVAVAGGAPEPTSLEEPKQVGALWLLHRRLRGRYPLAIALGVLLGSLGAAAGYFAKGPEYTSEALVQVQPTIPRTLYQTEENQMPPLFENFVATQAAMIESPRVFSVAVDDPDLRAAGWPAPPRGITQLKKIIKVGYRRGSQVITVEATCDDPLQAQRAVNAVLKTYESLYAEQMVRGMNDRIAALQVRRQELESELNLLRNRILKLGEMYGTDQLDTLHDARLMRVIELEKRVEEAAHTVALLDPQVDESSLEPPEVDLSLPALAAVDVELKQMLDSLEVLDAQVAHAQRFGPRHVQTRRLEEERQVLQARIDSRAEKIRSLVETGEPIQSAASSGGMTLPQARLMLARLSESLAAAREEATELGKTRLDIIDLRVQVEFKQSRLAETALQLEQLIVESQNIQQGRVFPIYGDLPSAPSRDRRLQFMVLGALGGAGLSVGFVLLIGLMRPSYRYLDEIEDAEAIVPVLGTLPDLTSRADDLDSLASLSVHHLRNMLLMQSRPRREGGTAFMITSARPGDGKTSLTVALGMSFAAQGVRTLMIDADLVGHGLSSSMGTADRPGLRQVARGADLGQAVFESRFSGLWVLAAGPSTRQGSSHNGTYEAEHLSAEAMGRLLEEARRQFAIILIDTGPLMGSLEANVAATVADRVVLTVPRGQDPRLVRAALGRLRSVGATCAGLVFNRATANDLRSSMSTISFHSQSVRATGVNHSESGAESRHALVRAILMSGKATDPEGRRPES